jgi:predicted small secreted protein
METLPERIRRLAHWRVGRFREGAIKRSGSETSGEFMMKKIFGLSLAATALLLAGCNTISGVGRDVSSVGSTVSKTADKHK